VNTNCNPNPNPTIISLKSEAKIGTLYADSLDGFLAPDAKKRLGIRGQNVFCVYLQTPYSVNACRAAKWYTWPSSGLTSG